MPNRFTEYNGIWLYTPEARALQELENLLGTAIPDISNNSMGSFGFIHESYHVLELRLFRSYFEESAQLRKLPKSIGNLTEMHTLDLSHNQLTDLPESIIDLTELEKFYLDYNDFREIPSVISSLEHLRQLNFDENRLQSIPSGIQNSQYLQSLHLAGNLLTQFPRELAGLRYLRRLVLNRNQIHHLDYTILDEFSRLYVLDLRANPIPEGQLEKALAFLRLSGKRRRKYYMGATLSDYEDPYSIRNISKRIRSDPLLGVNSFGEDQIIDLAQTIRTRYKQRFNS